VQKPADRYNPKFSPDVMPHQYKTDPEYKRSLLKFFVQKLIELLRVTMILCILKRGSRRGPHICAASGTVLLYALAHYKFPPILSFDGAGGTCTDLRDSTSSLPMPSFSSSQ
jgi:hypothetical protein